MRPPFVTGVFVMLTLVLNIIALLSTFIWQRKLQGEMAISGYDELKINKLNSTNWIRTIVFLIQAILVVVITIQAIK
jgi:hypothetical protein